MISFLILFSSFLRYPRAYKPAYNKEDATYTEIGNITQLTDHTKPDQSDKFTQRYLLYYRYDLYRQSEHKNKTKCVILDIGGETDTTMDVTDFGFLGLVASDIQARVITIEHRMFGESHPFHDTSVEHLQYLTVEQVLGDLKYFKQEYTRLHKDELDDNCRWLITGGSYSGLMSALARRQSMDDDTFYAAISSSGVVLATDNFTDFDTQDAISMGQECAAAARESRIQLMELIENGQYEYVSNLFNMKGLNQEDFYFVVGELFTLALQYNGLAHLCSPLVDASRANRDLVAALAKFAREYFIPRFCGTPDGVLETYDRDRLLKAASRDRNTGARSWLWMTCNEVAYWQVSPGQTGLRPTQLNQQYFRDQCQYVFPNEKDILPDVNAFNKKYGGLNQTSVTRVVYTTSSQDPWTWACITLKEQAGEDCYVHTIKGPEVGHCSDLHAPKSDDPIDLQRTQRYIRQLVKKWMTEEDKSKN